MTFNVADVPLLPDWILVTEAADMLGLSKQAVHGLIRTDKFESLHRLGQNADKPIYILKRKEVETMVTERSRSH